MSVIKGPDLEIQEKIVTAISSNTDVRALLGNPVRINPAQTQSWPGSYIMLGEGQNVPDLAECIDGSEVYIDIHIWSRADKSFADVKKIAATLWNVLSNATFSLSENRLLILDRDGMQYMRDPDGITLHGILTLRAVMEPA